MSKRTVTITPALSASPDYASGDCIGVPINIGDFDAIEGRVVELMSVVVKDLAAQGPTFTMYFFNGQPSGGTYTDNAAVSMNAADFAKFVGSYTVASASYTTATYKFFSAPNIRQRLNVDSALWVVIVAGGAYNAGTAADLTIILGLDA